MVISDFLRKMEIFIDFSIIWYFDFSKILKFAQNSPKPLILNSGNFEKIEKSKFRKIEKSMKNSIFLKKSEMA